jgi:hypothetical protein
LGAACNYFDRESQQKIYVVQKFLNGYQLLETTKHTLYLLAHVKANTKNNCNIDKTDSHKVSYTLTTVLKVFRIVLLIG